MDQVTVKAPRKRKPVRFKAIKKRWRSFKGMIGTLGTNLLLGIKMPIESMLDKMIEYRVERQKARRLYLLGKKLALTAIDRNQQCKACGAKDGDIRYDPIIKHVVHHCKVCSAAWAESPIIASQDWDFVGRDQEAAATQRMNVERLFSVQPQQPQVN